MISGVIRMECANEQLFCVLRKVFLGTSETTEISVTDEALDALFKLAKKHDIAHIIALGLKDILPADYDAFPIERMIFTAAYRYEQMNYDYIRLCEVLEALEVPFIPLKGAVMRQYYPEPWMRNSCDIDILINEKDLERTVSKLVKDCGYTYAGKCTHDVSLFTPKHYHIELHYDLIEECWANQASDVLRSVWDTTVPRENKRYWREMPDEMFYFYHISHMAKHVIRGGCGIRPFIDLWLLDRVDGIDKAKRDDLLKRGGLWGFATAVRKLSKIWIEGALKDRVSEQLENYILYGGVYGNVKNRIRVRQEKKGRGLKYVFSRIIIPYDDIKIRYSVLKKHRWLTPFMQIRRWFELIFFGRLRRVTKELRYERNMSDTEGADIQMILENIGL